MTRGVRRSGGGFFGSFKFLEILVGILVEGFDTALATKPDEFALVKAVDGLSHPPEAVAGHQAGLQGISFGLLRGLRFLFRGFDDCGLGRLGGGWCVGRMKGESKAGAERHEGQKGVFHAFNLRMFGVDASRPRSKAENRLITASAAFVPVGRDFCTPALQGDGALGGTFGFFGGAAGVIALAAVFAGLGAVGLRATRGAGWTALVACFGARLRQTLEGETETKEKGEEGKTGIHGERLPLGDRGSTRLRISGFRGLGVFQGFFRILGPV